MGREHDAGRIARVAAAEGADAVEVCLDPGAGGVRLLTQLLRELIELGRRDVSIVIHRQKQSSLPAAREPSATVRRVVER